jgi:hypothetical protein
VGLVEALQASEFLGREFATWLYWLSFKGNGTVALDGFEPFEIWFESPVELVNDYGEATSVVLKGTMPLESPEALRAFRENKKVHRAHIRLIFKNVTYTFSFHAARFLVSGLHLPSPASAGSGGEYLIVRFQLLEDFDKFWESLLEKFLALRLDDKAWRSQRKQIAALIAKATENES